MKVLFVTHYVEFYGANRSLLALVNGLKSSGFEVMILCPAQGALTKKLSEENIKWVAAPFSNWIYTKRDINHWIYPLVVLREMTVRKYLLKVTREFNPDCIYSNSFVVSFGHYLSKKLGIRHVWHIREFSKQHYNATFFKGEPYVKNALNSSTAIISISQSLIDVVLEGITVPIFKVFNGIMNEEQIRKLSLEEAPDLPETPVVFLIIGLLHPMKNQLEALNAFKIVHEKYPDSRLLIVGTGRKAYIRKLKISIKKYGLKDAALLRGYVPNPSEIFRSCHALLMCSRYEGMGRVTVEAMAYGKPVIGFRSGATPELIEHGKTGYIYDEGPHQLADCMMKIIEDPAKAREMGKTGQTVALSNFSNERYVRQIKEILTSILST